MTMTVPCPRDAIMPEVKGGHFGGLLVVCLLAYLTYTGQIWEILAGLFGLCGGLCGKRENNPFEFGIDTSDAKSLKDSVLAFPRKVVAAFSGPSHGYEGNVTYARVGGDEGFESNAPDDDRTIGEFDDLVEDKGPAFEERRPEDDRTKMLSGGIEVAKASVPVLAAPSTAGAAAGSFWQPAQGDNDLL